MSPDVVEHDKFYWMTLVTVWDHGKDAGLARFEVRVGRENVYNTESEELAIAKAESLRNEIIKHALA